MKNDTYHREYGAFLHWFSFDPPAVPVSHPWGDDCVLFGSGSDAFRSLLQHGRSTRGWQRLWAPSYFCQEVMRSLLTAGVQVVLYDYGPEDTCPLGARIRAEPGVLPRDISGSEWADGVDLGVRAITALGFDTGVTHMEWFRRDDGSLAIGEIAERPASGNHMDITGLAYDTDMDRAWAPAVVDDAFDGPFTRRYAVGCAYLRGAGSGQVLRVTGVDRVQEAVGRLIVEACLPQPGAPRIDSYEGDGYIIVRHPETEVVHAAVKTIIETVVVEYG